MLYATRIPVLRRVCLLSLLILTTTASRSAASNPAAPPPEMHGLLVAPIEGLTSTWHPAPAETAIPVGTTVHFHRRVPGNSTILWRGADEIRRDGISSTAECRLDRPGRHVVEIEYVLPDGRKVRERCVLNAITIRPEDIRIAEIRARVDPVPVDETSTNDEIYRSFRQGSIAALTTVAEDRYRTSTGRWVHFEADVVPAEFAPLIEWRLGPGRPGAGTRMGGAIRTREAHPGIRPIWVGPLANPKKVYLETYRVAITSHRSGVDTVVDGEPVTFTATTEPPGFENEITWLASTSFGTARPVLGYGAAFTVHFTGTWGEKRLTGEPFQWLGVRADNAIFNQDEKPIADIFGSSGEIILRIFPEILPEFPDGVEEVLALSSSGLGNTVVLRTAPPYEDCVENGVQVDPSCPEIQTEMTNLELAATSSLFGPVLVRLRDDVPSEGRICRIDADEEGNFLSGDSYFNIFADIEIVDFGLTLSTGSEAIRLQAGGITELPPFGRGYLPQPPEGGVCEQPGGTQTVPLFLDDFPIGELVHALHQVDEPGPRRACNIALTKIEGARKNTVGDFAQLPDPHTPGRLFLDTVAGGAILANPDQQDVTLFVRVTPPTLDPTKFEVLWEARDPDDPADHKDVDANDGGTPNGGAPKGGDNLDVLPEEANDGQHFFRMANHAISKRMSPGSDGQNAAFVIGKGTTELDGNRISSVKFHYGDEGGDNFILKAHCVRKANDSIVASDTSGLLTVWRKRSVMAHAMKKTNDDVQVHAKGATPGANVVAITPGPDGKTDTMILGGDDAYSGESVTAGANGEVETDANSGGDHFYPSNQATGADLLATLHTSFARVGGIEDFNHAAYIDFEVSDGNLALPFDVQIDESTTEWSEYLDTHLHGADKTHPNNTYDVVGIADFTGVEGTALQRPHVGIGVQFLRTHATALDVNGNVSHELGHALVQDGINTHDGHTDGADQTDCVFEQSVKGAMGLEVCEKHCLVLRRNVTRAWPNHDKTQIVAAVNARDSD